MVWMTSSYVFTGSAGSSQISTLNEVAPFAIYSWAFQRKAKVSPASLLVSVMKLRSVGVASEASSPPLNSSLQPVVRRAAPAKRPAINLNDFILWINLIR